MSVSFTSIDVTFRTRDVQRKKEWLNNIAKLHGKKLGDLSIVWCSDDYILKTNKQFLSHNYFTDIITFDYSDETPGFLSGDLLISIDTVRTNAKLYSQLFHVEQLRVMAHGLLHLIGFNDHSPEEKQVMRMMEDIAINLYEL